MTASVQRHENSVIMPMHNPHSGAAQWYDCWRASEASETLSGLFNRESYIREYGSTLYVGLARDVSPTNTNIRLTYLLTRLQVALYEDLAV